MKKKVKKEALKKMLEKFPKRLELKKLHDNYYSKIAETYRPK